MTDKLHVYTNGIETVVASDVDDAWTVWCAYTGESRADYDRFEFFERVDSSTDLPVRFKNESVVPVALRDRIELRKGKRLPVRVTATPEEWAQHFGRGFLCSAEF